jgi:hypothetical protein
MMKYLYTKLIRNLKFNLLENLIFLQPVGHITRSRNASQQQSALLSRSNHILAQLTGVTVTF